MLNHKTLFIDGRWQTPSGQGIAEVINPATEEVCGSVPLGDELDVENAVAAARRAFSSWSRTPSSVRAGYIRALADQLRNRADEMAAVITTELGMPVQWCRSVQVDGPIAGPAGVFNLVSGPGSKVGEALAKHPDVDMVSFTGSTGAGVRVAQAAAPSVKRVCLELGGKSPLLIAEDADLAAAVRYGVQDVMINSGQTCTALTRMLLPASRYAEAVELALAETLSLRMGDPLDPQNFLGPMCSAGQKRTVLDYIKVGQQEGARLLCGGDMPGRGFYVSPTLFADVDNRMRIAQEEIFGPVLCLIPYTDEAQAIQIANDSPFGLSSGVWAGNAERALHLGRQLRAGQCFLNGAAFNYHAPFGGYKQSGNGREWGEEGLNEFVEVKAIQV
ncbi:MAG: aldehyde dehydrogenase family protein [Pseudomonas fluorescens]|nr:aldehyde dehydrogenase family protein [Pseudomonas fluorescens]